MAVEQEVYTELKRLGLTCAICLEAFSDAETYAPFQCRHQLCKACGKKEMHSCPICRCTEA